MSLPRTQKKAQPPWLDLAVFAGVIAFVAYSVQSFLGGRAPLPAAPPTSPPLSELARAPDRAPASTAAGVNQGSTEVLRVGCLNAHSHSSFTSTARLMQIHCDTDGKTSTWHAVNRTSGEEILVFVNRREKSFSTSYFNLREGANNLEFVEDFGGGRTQLRKFSVTRTAD